MYQTVDFDTPNVLAMSQINLFRFFYSMMAYFTGIDTSFVLILRDNSNRLQIQTPHLQSNLDRFLSFLVHELMMQKHTAGQEPAEQPLLLVPKWGGGLLCIYIKGCNFYMVSTHDMM
uniref:Uncharacterized protein n=1 Tax=Anguilla anguilla TaxID=7936 RepID=A0A0E9XHA8_ANGAN